MKKTHLLLPAVLTLGLTACAPAEVTSSPDEKPAKAQKTQEIQAKVGDTITLKGNDEGLKVAVTVVKVAQKAKGKSDFDQPESGQRFAAVQVRLKNVGTIAYDDSPGNGAKVVDAQDQQYESYIGDVALGPSIGSSVKLAPGSTRKGYLVFSVPKKVKLTKFQFTLDSGFAAQSGEWLLK
ncbi:DUF4352 domain-containing protein [Actinomadura geliboluensis]|uniref:DUF4352 domain-containing protein n=1 Tax=Actinomadura geliboluensis TaxID=882440 RepID=UPI0036CEB248